METYVGPELLEYLPKHRVVQNGDTRDNKNLPTGRGVGYLHRFQRCILPHTNSQTIQEVHVFPHPGSVLPVQSTTLWPVHSTHGFHSGGYRGERGHTDGLTEGYKDPPVPGLLVGQSQVPPNLFPAYTDLGSLLSIVRLAGEQGEIRTGSKTGFQLRRLPVRPGRAQGQTHTRALAGLNQDSSITVRSGEVAGLPLQQDHAFFPRTSWLKKVQTVWPRWLYQSWSPLWIKSLEGDRSLCPVRTLHYHMELRS